MIPVLQAGDPLDAAGGPITACQACGEGMYCVPFMDGSTSFGILCLSDRNGSENKRRGLAFITAEYLSMTISNIRLKKRLYEMAVKDPLTGLYNRRHMNEILEKEIQRGRRNRLPLGVIMVDLDDFKRINDTFGHAAGDLVLQQTAGALVAGLRKEDTVCRFGGEEFLILLTDSTMAGSLSRAEGIRKQVADLKVQWEHRESIPITASIGVAAFPDHGETFDAIVSQADLALYKAKEGGRNRVASPDS